MYNGYQPIVFSKIFSRWKTCQIQNKQNIEATDVRCGAGVCVGCGSVALYYIAMMEIMTTSDSRLTFDRTKPNI